MNKFEAEALKRWPKGTDPNKFSRGYPRPYFIEGAEFGYTAGLEDAARAIEKAVLAGWEAVYYSPPFWVQDREGPELTTAELIEKYKTE